MKKVLPIGKDDFKRVIENNNYYIDKTLAIEELLINDSQVVLFPRPRRFGKSLFISMLENFFDIEKNSKDLFKDLKISKSEIYKQNLNKYPVIHLDFKSLTANTFESCYYGLRTLFGRLYNEKKDIIDILNHVEYEKYDRILKESGSEDDYKEALSNLCIWLERKYKSKVIVLIDEYDTPMDSGYNNRYYVKIMNIIRPIFSSTFKGNDSLKMGIMTGVLRVGGESLFSAFNNPVIYDVMAPGYNEYFGFTEDETKELLKYFDVEFNSDVKEYYNGYNFNGVHIYNPWSVLNYASLKELRPYWINTGSNTLIKNLIEKTDKQNWGKLEDLILGKTISFAYEPKLSYALLNSDELNSILNLMLVSGYLTLDHKDELRTFFRIPNREVQIDLVNIFEEITLNGNAGGRDDVDNFVEALIENDKEKAELNLNHILLSVSSWDNYEYFYHGLLLGLFKLFINSNAYNVLSNRESGYGRSDILILKKDKTLGIVVEVKRASNLKKMEADVKKGMSQLKEKNYKLDFLEGNVKCINEFVIVFHGRKAIVR